LVGVSAIQSFVQEDIIASLKVLFEDIMQTGYKLDDKCLRNELLILINYLMADPKALPFFYQNEGDYGGKKQMNFIEILLHYATIDEKTFFDKPIRTKNLKSYFGTSSEDIEFKKLVWSGILTAMQANVSEIIEIISKSFFLKSLLLYIDPLSNSFAVNRWSKP
jgi:hypothetical protein